MKKFTIQQTRTLLTLKRCIIYGSLVCEGSMICANLGTPREEMIEFSLDLYDEKGEWIAEASYILPPAYKKTGENGSIVYHFCHNISDKKKQRMYSLSQRVKHNWIKMVNYN